MVRKFTAWYTKGFPGGAGLRPRLTRVSTLSELREALSGIDRDEPFPPAAMRARRGKKGGSRPISLPPGWLDDPEDDTLPGPEAEDPADGG
jgi:hypothetical protein